jgi:uncharacterized protein YndB with AHSA1/START domain
MTVTSVTKDAEKLAMTFVKEFDAAVPRVWQLYADPRLLEQWWTPPEFPMTIVDHELSVGGYVRADVTGPGGEKVQAYWRITAVDAPRSMAWEDGFLDDQGRPNAEMPLNLMALTLAERTGGGTVMTLVTTFASVESMEMHVAMDLEEQMTAAFARAERLLG